MIKIYAKTEQIRAEQFVSEEYEIRTWGSFVVKISDEPEWAIRVDGKLVTIFDGDYIVFFDDLMTPSGVIRKDYFEGHYNYVGY